MLEGWREKPVCQGQGHQQVSPSLEDILAFSVGLFSLSTAEKELKRS